MVTNRYFKYNIKSEQDLVERLVIESLQMKGMDIYYLPRTIVNRDNILVDDIPSKFSNAYKIEMYMENVEGFGGEGHLFQKFGIEIRDSATFIVSRRRWLEVVKAINLGIVGSQPQNGDLIYIPMTNSLFEIMFVDDRQPFYQLANLNVFRMECELFEYNDETLDTGIKEIDAIETLGYKVELILDSDSDGIIIELGEIMTQTLADGVEVSGDVVAWNRATQKLSLAHITSSDGKFHNFVAGRKFKSSETPAIRTVIAVDENFGDHGHQNDVFDTEVNPFLVFDENNPFGSPE